MSVCRTVTYVMPLASAREEKKRTSKCGTTLWTLWSFIHSASQVSQKSHVATLCLRRCLDTQQHW